MRILVVGSGGREHAIVWKLKQSRHNARIYCAPGNAGIAEAARLVKIKADDVTGLLKFALEEKIDLTIVGPELPLANGIVDKFMRKGLNIFGPVKELSKLESSKAYAKEVMRRFNIPTADFQVFDNGLKARDFISGKKIFGGGFPIVIKADGLAAGKGVYICGNKKEAESAIEDIMIRKVFGSAGDKVVIEECLNGQEASILAVSDGINVVPLASSQDHKRAFDHDKGPNTGGMGAYSPAAIVHPQLHKRVMDEVIYPLINGLAKDSKFYKGVLYAGIMITKDGPKVLEFNARFGDPEAQAILPRMKTDLVDLCFSSIEDNIAEMELEWEDKAAVCVVLASGGYPGEYKKGFKISGLEAAAREAYIFHAGTRMRKEGENGPGYITDAGRVLNVVALGEDILQAVKKAYQAVGRIEFDGMHYRKDIAALALEHYIEDTLVGTLIQGRFLSSKK